MEQRDDQFGGLRRNSPLVEVVEAYYPSAPVSTVFEVLWEKLRALPTYRTSLEVNEAELWAIFLQTGMNAKAFIEALLAHSKEVYCGNPDLFEPDEGYYCLNDRSMLWEDFCGLRFFVRDRARLKGFLQEKIGRKFAVYPHDKQEYDDFIFDFREEKVFREQEEVFTLGPKTMPITKLLLENRGRKFTYEELADVLGESASIKHWQTAPSYKTSLDKIFERLNKACGKRIFQYRNNAVYVEP